MPNFISLRLQTKIAKNLMEKRKMAIPTNKNIIATITLILMLTIAFSIVALPTANAQATKKTYCYIGAIPNPVGVGQDVLLHVGITQELQAVTMGWEGLTVTVTKPDGTTETLGPVNTDSTGGTGIVFTPTMEGTYKLQAHFPQQATTETKRAGSMFTGYVPVGTVMLASDSDILELKVQAERIPYHPGFPLPNEYWTRPIDAQLREWSPIAGSWLWGAGTFGGTDVPNRLVPYNEDAPETAHILWTKPFTIGGLAGGGAGEHAFESGDAYEGKWSGSLILAGLLYYKAGAYDMPIYHCVDVHTGEELWAKTFLDNRSLSFGQLFFWDSFNYHGVFPYLWVATGGASFFGPPTPETWYAFDPYTGDWRFTVRNVPSGTRLTGPDGGLYKLQVDLTNGWMALWNLTRLVNPQNTGSPSDGSWGSAAHGKTFDATAATAAAQLAWSWNKTIPKGLPGSVQVAKFDDRVVGGTVTTAGVTSWSLSLKAGQEGNTIYGPKTWASPAEWTAGNLTVSWAGSSIDEGVFVVWAKELRKYYGFSTATGDFLWETESQYYLDFHVATQTAIAYGKLFSAGVSGIVYCYDLATGKRLWTYEANDQYQEILWANNWWAQILFITDGKLYMGHSEHSPLDPKPRGSPFYCLNATTGEVIFRIDGAFRQTSWGGTAIIGDSIIVTQDTYDQCVYAIGKGPSATTVSASPKVSVHGNKVLVEGMVTDISPGTKSPALSMRFPNGVPAVADESMSDWMLYVYKQFPCPANVKGVEIIIEVLDPNNNYYEVARATSDGSGFYSASFDPPVPGKYTIIARFAGSKAYYGSHAETAIIVEEAPPATPEATPTPASMAETYILGFGSAILAVVIIIGIVTILMLRKR